MTCIIARLRQSFYVALNSALPSFLTRGQFSFRHPGSKRSSSCIPRRPLDHDECSAYLCLAWSLRPSFRLDANIRTHTSSPSCPYWLTRASGRQADHGLAQMADLNPSHHVKVQASRKGPSTQFRDLGLMGIRPISFPCASLGCPTLGVKRD